MDSNNYDDNKSFTTNFTDKTSYYFNTSIGAYDLDSMILTFDPYLPSNLFLQLKCNIFYINFISRLLINENSSVQYHSSF